MGKSILLPLGTRVVRNKNKFSDDYGIPDGAIGTIVEVDPDGRAGMPLYTIVWDKPTEHTYRQGGRDNVWKIYEKSFDLMDPASLAKAKETAVLNKIKYLNERYAKSRTVSNKVPVVEPRQERCTAQVPALSRAALEAAMDEIAARTITSRRYSIDPCNVAF